jgi:hypothetical protein
VVAETELVVALRRFEGFISAFYETPWISCDTFSSGSLICSVSEGTRRLKVTAYSLILLVELTPSGHRKGQRTHLGVESSLCAVGNVLFATEVGLLGRSCVVGIGLALARIGRARGWRCPLRIRRLLRLAFLGLFRPLLAFFKYIAREIVASNSQ